MQRSTQNVLLEESNGVEGLVLRAGGHVSSVGKFRQESFHLLIAGHGGRLALPCPDSAPQRMNVGFLGGERFVLSVHDLSRPLHGLICMHKRLSARVPVCLHFNTRTCRRIIKVSLMKKRR